MKISSSKPEVPLLYSSLAGLWPLFSPPSEYVEEVDTFRVRLHRHGVADGASVLHLGSGGGSLDHIMKSYYSMTGVELSPAMIGQARLLNPDVEYVQGDMREVRLGRSFDAVLVHDAISYMTSVRELEAAYRTAAQHLRPGGIMIAVPEELKERLPHVEPSVWTHVDGETTLTVLETHHDADPTDTVHEAIYVLLIHHGDQLSVEVDRHTVGVFDIQDFLGAIERAGFVASPERWELSEWGDQPALPLITAVRTDAP